MKKDRRKSKKPVSQKIEEAFVAVAFAEAGEIYNRKPSQKSKKKGLK